MSCSEFPDDSEIERKKPWTALQAYRTGTDPSLYSLLGGDEEGLPISPGFLTLTGDYENNNNIRKNKRSDYYSQVIV